MEIKIRQGIVFRKDGLNEKWVRDELEKLCDVTDVVDGTVSSAPDANDEEEVRLFVIEGSMAQMLKVKLEFNCRTDDNYIMWPMEIGA